MSHKEKRYNDVYIGTVANLWKSYRSRYSLHANGDDRPTVHITFLSISTATITVMVSPLIVTGGHLLFVIISISAPLGLVQRHERCSENNRLAVLRSAK